MEILCILQRLDGASIGAHIILHGRLYVLELVQDDEHIKKFAQSQQIGFRNEIMTNLGMTESAYFFDKLDDGCILKILKLSTRLILQHTTNCIIENSFVISGCNTSTIFSLISIRFGWSFDFT